MGALVPAGRVASTYLARLWPLVKSAGSSITAAVLADYAVSTGKDAINDGDVEADVASSPNMIFPAVSAMAKQLGAATISDALQAIAVGADDMVVHSDFMSKFKKIFDTIATVTMKSTGDGAVETVLGVESDQMEMALAVFTTANAHISTLIRHFGSVDEAEKAYAAFHQLEPGCFDLYRRYAKTSR